MRFECVIGWENIFSFSIRLRYVAAEEVGAASRRRVRNELDRPGRISLCVRIARTKNQNAGQQPISTAAAANPLHRLLHRYAGSLQQLVAHRDCRQDDVAAAHRRLTGHAIPQLCGSCVPY